MPGKLVLFGPLPPPAGGVAIFMASLASNLEHEGIEHEVRCYLGSPPAGTPLVVPTVPSVLRRFADLGRRDVCLDSTGAFAEYTVPRTTRAWLALHRVRRFRWVKMLHDGTLPSRWAELEPERRRVAEAALHAADALVAVSDDLVRWLGTELGITDRVTRISSLLPIREPLPSEPSAAIRELRAAHAAVVCSVGAFQPNYGFASIASAVERLRGELGAEIGLVLVESSFSRDDAYASELLDGRPWVRVLRDLPRDQVLGVLRDSDAFVRATGEESYGLAKVEAVLAGTPVLATPVGETRGALLFETQDELVERLRAVLGGGQRRGDDGWPAEFRREAQDNLSVLLDVLGKRP